MKAVVLVTFDDIKAGIRRYQGEKFICSKERFAEINAAGAKSVGKPLVADAEKKE